MSVVINTNVDSTKIQNILTSSTDKLSQSMQRMSTGLKINSAKDDAAGTVISARMQVQLNGNEVAQKNVQNGNALLSTVEGNIDVVQDNISRIRDLALQAKNGTYSNEEIKAMDDEVQQRIAEINRVSYSSKFSSLKLFNNGNTYATAADKLAKDGATLQVGSEAGADNTIKANESIFKSVEFSALSGLQNFKLTSLTNGVGAQNTINTTNNVTVTKEATDTEFDTAVKALDAAIDNLTSRKSEIGSAGNRLDSALSTLTTQFENLSSSKSLITDADIASEASKYTQNQILQQISTSLLAQANSAPSVALSLV
jgi:flagellin